MILALSSRSVLLVSLRYQITILWIVYIELVILTKRLNLETKHHLTKNYYHPVLDLWSLIYKHFSNQRPSSASYSLERLRNENEDKTKTQMTQSFNQYSENETKIWHQNILNQFNRVSSSCLRSHFVISLLNGSLKRALTGEKKRHVFEIPCEMQRGLDLLHPDYRKERNKSRRWGNSFGVWRHSATKRKWR